MPLYIISSIAMGDKEYLLKKYYDLAVDERRQKWLTSDPVSICRFERIAKELGQLSEQVVLDIGCGSGELGIKLREMGKRSSLIGIDISKRATKLAKQNLDDVVLAHACYVPFRPNSIPCVVCSEVIEHVLQPKKLLHEIGICLVDGGILILTTPNGSRISRLVLKKIFRRILNNPEHIDEYTPNEIISMIKDEGLRITKILRICLDIPYPITRIIPFELLSKILGISSLPICFYKVQGIIAIK